MQEKINLYLNRRFPDFLSSKEGIIYFILLIPILSYSIILFQPRGLYNWHEFHKNLVVLGFCFTFLSTYAILYIFVKSFFPNFINSGHWTISSQLKFLLTVFYPAATCTTLVFMLTNVEEFQLDIISFFQLQYYNIIICVYTALIFGYFVSIKLKKEDETEEIKATGEVEKAEKIPDVIDIVEQEAVEVEIVTDNGLVITPVSDEMEAACKHSDVITLNGIPFVVNDICYAESKVNDLHLWILLNGLFKEIITRYTLKKLERDLKPYSQFLRCQKSFIVNIHHLKDWDIVDEKMVLHPKYCTVEISVWRNKTETIKEILRKNYVFKAK